MAYPGGGGLESSLGVSRIDNAALVQVFGLGNMHLAPTLHEFVHNEIEKGTANFIVDLRECTGMDSTFMGTFIGLSDATQAVGGWFCLVNPGPDNLNLLKMLGVHNMVTIHDDDFPSRPQDVVTMLHPTDDAFARLEQVREAHLRLVDADPENKARFGPFLKAMEAELSVAPVIIPVKERKQQ